VHPATLCGRPRERAASSNCVPSRSRRAGACDLSHCSWDFRQLDDRSRTGRPRNRQQSTWPNVLLDRVPDMRLCSGSDVSIYCRARVPAPGSTFMTACGLQVPSMIEGSCSFGQYIRSIRIGSRRQLACRSRWCCVSSAPARCIGLVQAIRTALARWRQDLQIERAATGAAEPVLQLPRSELSCIPQRAVLCCKCVT
jgi:hypothetical protein